MLCKNKNRFKGKNCIRMHANIKIKSNHDFFFDRMKYHDIYIYEMLWIWNTLSEGLSLILISRIFSHIIIYIHIDGRFVSWASAVELRNALIFMERFNYEWIEHINISNYHILHVYNNSYIPGKHENMSENMCNHRERETQIKKKPFIKIKYN